MHILKQRQSVLIYIKQIPLSQLSTLYSIYHTTYCDHAYDIEFVSNTRVCVCLWKRFCFAQHSFLFFSFNQNSLIHKKKKIFAKGITETLTLPYLPSSVTISLQGFYIVPLNRLTKMSLPQIQCKYMTKLAKQVMQSQNLKKS